MLRPHEQKVLLLVVFFTVIFTATGLVRGEDRGNYKNRLPYIETRKFIELSEDDAILGLANQFYQENDFLRAAREYLLYYKLFPDSPLAQKALLSAGLSYIEIGQWRKASEQFEKLENDFPDSPLLPQALYLKGKCLKSFGQLENARSVWARTFEKYPDSLWGQRSEIEIALSRGEEGDYVGALSGLMELGPNNFYRKSADRLINGLKNMDEIPRKSPVTAGFLSALFPGSGQFYLGRYRHGSMALILNFFSIAGAIEAVGNNDDGLAGVLFLAAAVFYSANIVGSIGAAHKMNRQTERDYFLKLERQYFLQENYQHRGQVFGLRLRFEF